MIRLFKDYFGCSTIDIADWHQIGQFLLWLVNYPGYKYSNIPPMELPQVWAIDDRFLQSLSIELCVGLRYKRVTSYVKTMELYIENQFSESEFMDEWEKLWGKILYSRFGLKWRRLWETLNAEYNPIENYNMLETRTPDLTETIDGEQNTDLTTQTTTEVNGFNSSQPVPSGKVTSDTDGSKLTNTTGSTKTNTGTETLERSGNIGVTTSQQMMTQEWEIRQKDYWKMVFDDISSVLCRGLY